MKGFTYKKDQIAAAQKLVDTGKLAARTANDSVYEAKLASDDAALLDAVASQGPAACAERLLAEEARLDELQQKLLADRTKPEKAELRALEKTAALLGPLAGATALQCTEAVAAAKEVERVALLKVDTDKAEADRLALLGSNAMATAKAITDLTHKQWDKDQTDDGSVRAQETALHEMRDELKRLGATAPPGAVQHCDNFAAMIDARAHKAVCAHCTALLPPVLPKPAPVTHALERSAAAKLALTALLDKLDRLAATLPEDVAGLGAQDARDREIGVELKTMADTGLPKPGKMIGVLICEDGTTYQAFSGDIGGKDDVEGWSVHIPPVGGTLKNAMGVERDLTTFKNVGTPHGVCAAPKLIQRAYREGKVPKQLAEAWYGQPGGGKFHRGLVVSCATCMENLGFQLCTVETP